MAIKSAARKSATTKPVRVGKPVPAGQPPRAGKTARNAKSTKPSMTVAATASQKRAGGDAAKALGSAKAGGKKQATIAVGAVEIAHATRTGTQIDGALPQAWLEPWTQVGAATVKLLGQDAFTAAVERNMQFYQTMARLSPLHLTLQMMQGLLPSVEPRA